MTIDICCVLLVGRHGKAVRLTACRATLVICCVSLVGQWIDEASSKLAGTTKGRICQYHGPNRVRDVQKMAANYDVVVGTAPAARLQRACLPSGACLQLPEHSTAQPDCPTVAGCR